jgi:hypothetical protein
MSFLTRVQDLHQNLSWKLGHGRGKEGRAYSCPWWVDKMVYSLAYMQGKGIKIPSNEANERPSSSPQRPGN